MQTYRIVPRSAPRACRAACSPASAPASRNIFNTPFFFPGQQQHQSQQQQQVFNPIAELAPLFRVLDSAMSELAPEQSRVARHQNRRRGLASFTPRFDVREADSAYELQGEVPGLEQKDLEIEFVDAKTLVVRGSSSSGREQESTTAAAAPAAADNTTATVEDTASEKSATNSYHKASVEDEDGFVDAGAEAETETETEKSETAQGKTPENTTTAAAADPATSVPNENNQNEPQPNDSGYKYWLNERSTVGAFERRFVFPVRVDQAAVKASLRNGVLSVAVPKVIAVEGEGARRIEIE